MKRISILVSMSILAFAVSAAPSVASASPLGFSVSGKKSEGGPEFRAEAYPAAISGEQVTFGTSGSNKIELKTIAGTFKCGTATFSSSVWAPKGLIASTSELMQAPSVASCTLAGISATVAFESDCNYNLVVTNGELPYYFGSIFMCGMTIDPAGTGCIVSVPKHTYLGVNYSNVGSGSSAYVKAEPNLVEVEYEVVGSKCIEGATEGYYYDGRYKGAVALKAATA